MTDFFESKSFVLPSEVKNDLAAHMKEAKGVKSLEFQFKGENLQGAKEFAQTLLSLKKRGVKISHELTIRLDFPREISREKTLSLVDSLPRPVNGFVKARIG